MTSQCGRVPTPPSPVWPTGYPYPRSPEPKPFSKCYKRQTVGHADINSIFLRRINLTAIFVFMNASSRTFFAFINASLPFLASRLHFTYSSSIFLQCYFITCLICLTFSSIIFVVEQMIELKVCWLRRGEWSLWWRSWLC